MRDGNSTSPGGSSDVTRTGVPETPANDVSPGLVHVVRTDRRVRIVLSGEIDADLSPELAQAGTEAEHTRLPIEIDARRVTFMDSSGVSFMAGLAQRTEHRIRLIHAPNTVRFLLDVTRIGELLDVVEPAES